MNLHHPPHHPTTTTTTTTPALGRCVIDFETTAGANLCLSKNGTINLNGHLIGIIPFSPSHLSLASNDKSISRSTPRRNDQVKMMESFDYSNAKRFTAMPSVPVSITHGKRLNTWNGSTPLVAKMKQSSQNMVLTIIFILSIIAIIYSVLKK